MVSSAGTNTWKGVEGAEGVCGVDVLPLPLPLPTLVGDDGGVNSSCGSGAFDGNNAAWTAAMVSRRLIASACICCDSTKILCSSMSLTR